jgi:predicted lipoprotein with Yx(FWY)xxD motif
MRSLFGFVALGFLVASCGGSAGPAASTSPSPSASPTVPVIAVASKTVKGQTEDVLTDTSGKTLYYLTSDTATTPACSGGCVNNWPPLVLDSGDPGSATTLPGKLTTGTTPNGRVVLYNGHPLYRFVRDATDNDSNGEGINAFGGTWHVATPSLAAM